MDCASSEGLKKGLGKKECARLPCVSSSFRTAISAKRDDLRVESAAP
jgi:hypothetical protein